MRKAIPAGLAALVLAVLSAPALGSGAHTVRIQVPASVNKGQQFTVKAVGKASGGAQLAVYLSRHQCASSASGSTRVISTHVNGTYSKAATLTANASGTYYACGYLTAGGTTVAHTSKRYVVKELKGPQILQFVVTPAPQQCTAAYVNYNVKDSQLLKTVVVALGDGSQYSSGNVDSYTDQNLVQHGYVNPGTYTVTLTATDVGGLTKTVSKTINDPGCPGATS